MTERARAAGSGTPRAGWFATLATVAGAELRRWWRHPVAVGAAVLCPIVMAALISVALGQDVADFTVRVAVVDHEQGAASQAFIDEALGHHALRDLVEVEVVDSERAADRMIDDDEADAAVVLPTRLSQRLAGDGQTGIEVQGDNPMAIDLVGLVVDRYLIEARVTAIALERTGVEPLEPWPLQLDVTAPDGSPLDAATHYGPGVGMFFVLISLGFAAQRFVADRQRGLVDRFASARVSPTALLAGRSMAALAVGGLSLVTTAATMQFLFGRSWGPVVPVGVLMTAVVIALAGVAAVTAGLSRTAEQAQLLSIGIAMTFALASGTFTPPGSIGTRPAFADLVPTTHALDGFALLATERPPVAEITTPLGVLLMFGLAGLGATALIVRRPA